MLAKLTSILIADVKTQEAHVKYRIISEGEFKDRIEVRGFSAWINCTNEQVKKLADDMIKDWGAYNCFSANCQHFAKKLYYRILSGY